MKISKSKYKGTSQNSEAVFDLSTSSSSNDVNNSKPNTKVSAASQTKSTLTNAFNALFGRSRSTTLERKTAVTKSDEQARSSKKPVIIGLNTTVSLSTPQASSPEVFTTSVEHISGTFTGSHTNQNLSQSLSQILESDGSRPTSTLTVPHTLRPRSSSLSVVNTETRSLCNSPRDSLAGSVILKEGYLNKKADTYQGSTIGLGRGWKVYRVVLKGAKLYFYKPPTENEIKSIFPLSRKGRPLTIASESVEISPKKTTASPRSSSKGLKLASASFTSPTRALIFETTSDNSDSYLSPVYNPGSSSLASRYFFGECFTEVDPINFRFKRYVCLLIFEDVLVICKRKWVKQHRNSLFDAVNDAFRFTNGGGVPIDSFIQDEEKAVQSGKGYYTKWKHGTTYRLDSIDVIEASSTSFTRPSDKQQYNSNRTSIFSHSNSSIASIDLDHSGSNIQAMQIFVGGPNAARRLFVAKAEEQQTWIIKFNMAKSSLSRKSAKLRRSEDHLNSSFNLSRTNLSSTSLHRDESKLRSQKSDPVIRGRLYWGTQMHPELITSRVSGEKSDTGTIIGGSIDSLIHELLFQNTESQESNFYNCSQFINAFLTTFTCFTTPAHLVKELRRCAMMGIPEELKVAMNAEDLSILNRLQKILTVWITEFNINIDQETLESIETVAVDLLTKDPNFIMEQFRSLLYPLKRKSDSLSLRNSLCISLPTIHEGSHLNHLALDFASLNRSGLSPTIFLKISPEDFAQELYVFHTRCKARVDSQTLSLKRLLPITTSTTDSPATVQNTPSMSLANVFLFTVSDPHFLTKLVYNHLVTNAQSMHPSRRSTILVHWIRVAEASKALGDMVSWIAIALAICSPIVVRLRETWKGIDKRMYYKVVH
ncbi:hypothetical protein K7432_007372 [Basidiobolus ranarum]|uniref:Uncharacterized protein n=1 Tax=Basidiobolus ranarum TaxID=34480 RepID=A0ABR2W0M5_9FUNG